MRGLSSPSTKGVQSHNFRSMSVVAKRLERLRSRLWPRRLCVRWGPTSPFPKRGRNIPSQFSPHVHCGQTAGWIKITLGMEIGLGPGDIVLDGDSASLPKKGADPPPQFSARFYCGQTAGCIMMPLGTELGLSLGDFVLDRDPAPSSRRGRSRIFGLCLL